MRLELLGFGGRGFSPVEDQVGQASACLLLNFAAVIEFKGRQAKACPTKNRQFQISPAADGMRENRAEARTSIMARVDALWEDESGTPRVVPAKLEDKSPGGLSIRIMERIPVGSSVTIHWERGHISGSVTYCLLHRGEYVVGIQRDAAASFDPR